MELSDFLLYRIAEDEEIAERCVTRNAFGEVTSYHPYRHQIDAATLPQGSVAVPAPGFLADCDAKRRIVEGYREAHRNAIAWSKNVSSQSREFAYWDVLRALALPYADHPDYDEAWRP